MSYEDTWSHHISSWCLYRPENMGETFWSLLFQCASIRPVKYIEVIINMYSCDFGIGFVFEG